MADTIAITEQPILIEQCQLPTDCAQQGAVVTFAGYVRDFSEQPDNRLVLHAYRPMTDSVLAQLVADAHKRWQLSNVSLLHRIGEMQPSDLIVYIAVGSRHRKAAFEACQYLIDVLKTTAPFWKQEQDASGAVWVQQTEQDKTATDAWSD